MTRSWSLVKNLDYIVDAVTTNPVMAARMSRAGFDGYAFLMEVNLWIEGYSSRYCVSTEAPRIRRRAKRNRKRNRAARMARRVTRDAT